MGNGWFGIVWVAVVRVEIVRFGCVQVRIVRVGYVQVGMVRFGSCPGDGWELFMWDFSACAEFHMVEYLARMASVAGWQLS